MDGRLQGFAEREPIGVQILVSMTERYAEILAVAGMGSYLAQLFFPANAESQ